MRDLDLRSERNQIQKTSFCVIPFMRCSRTGKPVDGVRNKWIMVISERAMTRRYEEDFWDARCVYVFNRSKQMEDFTELYLYSF
jgi:hypothetical protein